MSNKLSTVDVLNNLKKATNPKDALSKVTKTKSEVTVFGDSVLIIIADYSVSMDQSMGTTSKINALKRALTNDISPKLSGWTYGVIGFGTSPADTADWIVRPTKDPKSIVAVNNYGTVGCTPMLHGLEMAWNWATHNASKARFILISDGQPTDCGSEDLLNRCRSSGNIPIDTIGVGSVNGYGYDENLLRSISKITGGMFSRVDSVSNFASTLIALSPEKRLLLGTIK